MNSFLPEELNGIVSVSLDKQMKGYTISKDLDTNSECPLQRLENLSKVAFLQNKNQVKNKIKSTNKNKNINIDTTQMDFEDQKVLMKLLQKNKQAVVSQNEINHNFNYNRTREQSKFN